MKGIYSYDLMESIRNTNEWIGASARAMASYPVFGLSPNPAYRMLESWGAVTERSFSRMVMKPDWGIRAIAAADGRDHMVEVQTLMDKSFGSLIHFNVQGRDPMPRRILLVAPMSGHYATLMRSTVISLLPDAEVYVTDWKNARDIPVSEGKFDVEDYTSYLVDFMRELGPDINVIAVCQPAPLALAATAYLAEEDPKAQPRTLTLIGGPIDPDAAATEVTDFGRRITMGQLEQMVIQRVGYRYKGVGRMVYPGLMQLASFISMNAETHSKAFLDKIMQDAKNGPAERDRHNRFYDEYLSVMDMTAEFYLSTVERIFKGLEIAQNKFTIKGKKVDIGKITTVAVKTVEGEKDDISAPGQCVAALDLCTGLPDNMKQQHLEPKAGHYGIFAGGAWRNNIRPIVLNFIDEHASDEEATREVKGSSAVTPMGPRKSRARKPAAAEAAATVTKSDAPNKAPTRKPRAAKAAAAPKAATAEPVAKAAAPAPSPAAPVSAAQVSAPAASAATPAPAAPKAADSKAVETKAEAAKAEAPKPATAPATPEAAAKPEPQAAGVKDDAKS